MTSWSSGLAPCTSTLWASKTKCCQMVLWGPNFKFVCQKKLTLNRFYKFFTCCIKAHFFLIFWFLIFDKISGNTAVKPNSNLVLMLSWWYIRGDSEVMAYFMIHNYVSVWSTKVDIISNNNSMLTIIIHVASVFLLTKTQQYFRFVHNKLIKCKTFVLLGFH